MAKVTITLEDHGATLQGHCVSAVIASDPPFPAERKNYDGAQVLGAAALDYITKLVRVNEVKVVVDEVGHA